MPLARMCMGDGPAAATCADSPHAGLANSIDESHIDRVTVSSAVPGGKLFSDSYAVISVTRHCSILAAPPGSPSGITYDWQSNYLDVFISQPMAAVTPSTVNATTFTAVATRVPCTGPGDQTSSFVVRLPPGPSNVTTYDLTYFAVRAVFTFYAYQAPPPAVPCPNKVTLNTIRLDHLDVDTLVFAAVPARGGWVAPSGGRWVAPACGWRVGGTCARVG